MPFELTGPDKKISFSGEAARICSTNETSRAAEALQNIAEALKNKTISDKEAIMLTTPEMFESVIFSSLDQSAITAENTILKHNLGAPGAATGTIVTTTEDAKKCQEKEQPYILMLPETGANDMDAIKKSAGVITFDGGPSSHASIVTRQIAKPAIIGTGDLSKTIKAGDIISIDGSSGHIIRGKIKINTVDANNMNKDVSYLLEAAHNIPPGKAARMAVKASTDSPGGATEARKLGAKGIGVTRTEHMFFDHKDRLEHVQDLITAPDKEARIEAVNALFAAQKEDFKGIFKAMGDLPVTIRLLDAPKNEFVPKADSPEAYAMGERLYKKAHKLDTIPKNDAAKKECMDRANALIKKQYEENPMLGARSVRMGIMNPEIYEMQVKAILQAAAEVEKEKTGVRIQPQIMIPMVHKTAEVEICKKLVDRVVWQLKHEAADRNETFKVPDFKFGVMMETPGACEQAGAIAPLVDFFSFGTNDLTQTQFAMSRGDVNNVINKYQEIGIYKTNPFQTLDPDMKNPMKRAIDDGKKARPGLQVSICGEHGGDPQSILMCQDIGMDAVSVSPPRIPVAQLVTTQAMIRKDLELGRKSGELGEWTKRQQEKSLNETRYTAI